MADHPRSLLRSLGRGLSTTLVTPVREGTFALREHSASAVGVAIVAAVVFGGLLVAIVAARPLRHSVDLISAPTASGLLAVPGFLVPALLAAATFAFALLIAGAIRCRALVAMPVVLVVLLLCFVLVASGSSSTIGARPPWEGYVLVALTGATAVAAGRWRGSVLRDVTVLVVLLEAIAVVCQRDLTRIATESGVRIDIATLALVLTFVTTLALPLSVASGLGAVDASAGLVLGVTRGLTGSLPRAALVVLALALGVWQWWVLLGGGWTRDRLLGWLSAGIVLMVCALIWWRCRVPGTRDADDAVRSEARRFSLPVAYGLASAVLVGGLISLVGLGVHLATGRALDEVLAPVGDGLLGIGGITLARVVVVVFLAIAGVVLRRRGQGRAAALAWIDAILIASYALSATTPSAMWWPWSLGAMADVGLIALTLLAGAVALRRRASSLLVPLVITLALIALLRRADALSAPVTLIVGGSATAVLVVGLAWGFLTDGASAHRHTPGLPRDGRLLLLLGNFIFTAAVVAWAAIGLQSQPYDDLQAAANVGVQTLGTGLLVGMALMTIASWRRQDT